MVRKIRMHAISGSPTLKEKIQGEWQKIALEELKNLVASIPRLLQAVINAGSAPWWFKKYISPILTFRVIHKKLKKDTDKSVHTILKKL